MGTRFITGIHVNNKFNNTDMDYCNYVTKSSGTDPGYAGGGMYVDQSYRHATTGGDILDPTFCLVAYFINIKVNNYKEQMRKYTVTMQYHNIQV